jgi:hypothetical protein
MPFLVPIATAIGTAIAAIASAAAGAVAVVVSSIASVVIPVMTSVGGVLSTIGITVASTLATVGSAVAGAIGSLGGIIAEFADWAYYWGFSAYSVLYNTFGAVLEAIHFKLILEVHTIALLVSEDYRNIMTRVYNEISEVSAALGFAPEFLALALRNVRTLVLDVSSTLGHKYDLAEVAWLKTFSDSLNWIAINANKYEKNPGALFADLADYVERHFVDTKGGFQQITLGTLEGVVKQASKFLEEFGKIGVDIGKLASDLPEFVRAELMPFHLDAIGRVSGFISDHYLPMVQSVEHSLAEYHQSIEGNRLALAEQAKKILTPKETLLAAAAAAAPDRDAMNEALTKLENERRAKLFLDIAGYVKPIQDAFEKVWRAPQTTIPAPVFLTYTPGVPTRPSLTPALPGGSPFVGDY